jgi:hypothetical protein
MKKNLVIKALSICGVFLLLTSGISVSQDENKISSQLLRLMVERGEREVYTAWIFFADKGPQMAAGLAAAKAGLNPRAVLRRLRHHRYDETRIIDHYDIPVYPYYAREVESQVNRLRIRSRWLNAVSVEATGRTLRELSGLLYVRKIDTVKSYVFPEPGDPGSPVKVQSREIKRSDSEHSLDYGGSFGQVSQINVPALHERGLDGSGVLICMLDGGFDNLDHQALDHIDIVDTWDFVNDDPIVWTQDGQMGAGDHGTNTLGVIAGYYPGKLIGPVYGASFILGKTENNEWERHLEEDHWIAGAEWADEKGADIISSSLGYRDKFTNEADYTWEELDGQTTIVAKGANVAAGRGILIVNSAGNEGPAPFPTNTLVSPADCAQVLAAGAVNYAGDRVNFSSMGPTADGRIKPDVMAMGLSVVTAHPDDDSRYELVDGTSFSAPLTAGAAALILQANPTWSNLDIMDALKATASRANNPSNEFGWGIVDAAAAADFTPKGFYPPDNFAVKKLVNDYLFFVQYVEKLSWSANPRNSVPIKNYRIYTRHAHVEDQPFELLVEVSGQTYSFERRGLLPEEEYLYKITSVDESGQESEPSYAR